MKHFLTLLIILFSFFSSSYAQQGTIATLTASAGNFSSFSQPEKYLSAEVPEHNKGYEQDAELGMLFPEAPCKECYELLGARTENSKTFLKAGTQGKDMMMQTA